MDPAQLNLELLETNEHLLRALADECKARAFDPSASTLTMWEDRLRAARREVKWRAERYANALRNYRLEVLGEFAPQEVPASWRPGRISGHRERTRASAGSAASGIRYLSPPARKEIAADASGRAQNR
jgi:hypothetical protein